jgi:arylsulfatase A
LIANWPGRIAPGKVNRDLVVSVDFLPTICAAAGVALPKTLPPDGHSFFPQLLGDKGEPRQWAYCWYAPDGGATPKYEFAMTTQYKLYRDGTFFDLGTDWFEEKPLRADKLSGDAAAAAQKLRSVLDDYATARPAHLLQPLVTAKQAKKADRQKKKN